MHLIRLTLLIFLLPAVAFADGFAEKPTWVEDLALPIEIASAPEDFVKDGVLQIISDRQVALRVDGQEVYTRRVQKVVSRTGLENMGAIRIDFELASEGLHVHKVWRIRDGVRSQVTGLEFISIRRESEIDYGILDGRLTHYAHIGDLRVGDTIDVSWTRRVQPEVFAGHFLQYAFTSPYSAVQIDQTRILAPEGISISIQGPAQPTVSSTRDVTEYLWRHENVIPPDYDSDTQSWQEVFGFTYIARATDWETVVDEIRNRYEPTPLPLELAKRVAQFGGSEEERVTAAFRLVQDEIRYLGIEIGAGGYIPRAPSLVWSRRFGDCKDKALLLISMLDQMNIPADVVLVHNRSGEDLADHPPSPYAFNHAVVRVHGRKGDYFLDPTDVLQGGVGSEVTTLDFAWALPVSEGSDRLVIVPRPDLTQPDYEVTSRYDFDTQASEYVAELVATTTYRGESADYQRWRYSSQGTKERATSFLDWYQDRYPGAVALTPLSIEDDLDANTLTVHEHYGLTEDGMEEHWSEFWLNPYATKGELPKMPEDALQTEFHVSPFYHRHRIELVGIGRLKPFPEHRFLNDFFRFERTSFDIEGGIAGVFELQTLTDKIQPEEAEIYETARLEARGKRDRRYDLGGPALLKVSFMGLSPKHSILSGVVGLAFLIGLIGIFCGFRGARFGV